MLSFKQYISEGQGSSRMTAISPESAFQLIDKHCKRVAENMSHQIIYRGGGGDGTRVPFHGNSNAGKERRSANTANWFTLWHDNHPDWAKFPKRSRSFICANDYHIAHGFGSVHILVPFDNAHVGVVPDEDLFGAINSPDGDDLSEFNQIINSVLEVVQKKHGLEYPKTYSDLKKQLGLATRELLKEANAASSDDDLETALNHMKQFTSLTYYDVVDNMYSPKGKGFAEGKAASISLPSDASELYVQGEAIFLPWNESSTKVKAYGEDYLALLNAAMEKYEWELDL